MKMHKFEVYVIDFGDRGAEEIAAELENNRYYSVQVKDAETTDIGAWTDNHELNRFATVDTCRKYFRGNP